MKTVNGNSLSPNEGYFHAGVRNEAHRHSIRDFFEKSLRPMLSRAKDRVRKVKDIFPVFVRGKKFTKFAYV